MAKFHGLIKGDMKGNAGQLSFRQQGGMTIVSGRIYNNKSAGDGASYAQRLQRIKIAGAVNLFKAIQAFEKKAWEGKPARVSDYNMFMQKNLNAANVYFTKEEANLGACVPMRCVVSTGSLSSINMSWLTPAITTNLAVGDYALTAESTIAELAAAIIANNSGYMVNDKITFGLLRKVYMNVGSLNIPQVQVEYIEFNLDITSTDLVADVLKSAHAKFDIAGSVVVINNADGTTSGFGDGAIIVHTRETSGRLLCSTQMMVLPVSSGSGDDYSTDEAKQAAAESYGYQGKVLIQPGMSSDGGVTPPEPAPVKRTVSVTVNAPQEMNPSVLVKVAGETIGTATKAEPYSGEVDNNTEVTFEPVVAGGAVVIGGSVNGTSVASTDFPYTAAIVADTSVQVNFA